MKILVKLLSLSIIILIFSNGLIFAEDTNALMFYRITKNDVLKIDIYPDGRLSAQRQVSDVGSISIDLIGTIYVENMTLAEAERIIEKKLSQYYFEPRVVIEIISIGRFKVTAIGYKSDGSDNSSKQLDNFELQLPPGETLRKALTRLGWQGNVYSKHSKIIVTRKEKKVLEVDLFAENYDAALDFTLLDSDLIVFEPNVSGYVRITGYINTPGIYKIPNKERKTIQQLILEAGGFKRDADISKIKLIKKTNVSDSVSILIDLKNNTDFDTELDNNDYVEVPGFIVQQIKKITMIGPNISASGEVALDETRDNFRLTDILGKMKFYIENPNNDYIFTITSRFHPPITVNIIKYLDGNDIEHNPLIYPEDIIRLQISDRLKPYAAGSIKVLGNFVNPGKYTISDNTRLIDALSLAGWKYNDNEPVSIVIIDENGLMKEYDINRYLSYGDVLHNPEVLPNSSVYVKPIGKNKVFMVGQLAVPGYYDLNGLDKKNTLARFIFKAGGLKDNAAVDRIRIMRDNITTNINMNDYFYSNKLESDVRLQKDDIVYVPPIQKMIFYVFGMVNKMGKYDTEKPVTVLEAITMAGGYKYTGSIRNVQILRGSRENPKIINVNLNDILNNFIGTTSNYVLEDNDIVYVPKSPVTNVKDFLDNIVPTLYDTVDLGKRIKDY